MWNVSTNIMLRPQDMPLVEFAEEYGLDVEIKKSLDEHWFKKAEENV